jgi:hypothetical protein
METYLIIESYRSDKSHEIYQRFSEKGRMLPQGVEYVDSWVEMNMQKCYQIMRSESLGKLLIWTEQWKDLVDFEIIPVLTSEEVVQKLVPPF